MTRRYANNAVSTLASGIAADATSLTVAAGHGARFPTLLGGDFFTVTLTQASDETSWEEVKVTDIVGDVLTIVRAQEGSTAAIWAGGDKVELRWTAVAAQLSANVASCGMVTVDFGAAPGGNVAVATVMGQDDIGDNAQVDAWIMGVDSADHNAYEHMVAPIQARAGNIVPGVGFDVFCTSTVQLTGQFAIQWVRTQ